MAQVMRNKYPDYPIPSRTVPKFVVKLMAPFLGLGMTRRYVEDNVDIPIKVDNSKSKEQLGIEYRSLDETMNDMFRQLIDEGVVKTKEDMPSANIPWHFVFSVPILACFGYYILFSSKTTD
jgi:dihydroflavonol-4-reductase